MKKLFLIVTAVLLSSNLLFGQVNNIESDGRSGNNKETIVTEKSNKITGAISERFFTTAIIIGETILLLVIVGYWRRTRTDSKDDSKSVFKKNINAIRLEKVRRFEDKKISIKRKTLYSKMNQTSIDGKFITNKAKKLELSKGEIFLAAKLKQLSRQAI
ncbi:MAG: hypothetical protein GY936_12485 [Ignavibacteriae bacterium]|nr:hypothetical protein [Ignavibacteriota bacterium]